MKAVIGRAVLLKLVSHTYKSPGHLVKMQILTEQLGGRAKVLHLTSSW